LPFSVVLDYVAQFASENAANEAGEDEGGDGMSSVGSYESDENAEEEQPAGEMEEL